MAAIQVSTGGRRRASGLHHEVALIPLIDLLLCCVMFLLATAVWSDLGRLKATHPSGGGGDAPLSRPAVVFLHLTQSEGYVLRSTLGDEVRIPLGGDADDVTAMTELLRAQKAADPRCEDLVVTVEDGVRYERVVRTLDAAAQTGGGKPLFENLSVATDSAF